MARILMWFSDHFRTEIDLRICHKNDWLIFDHSATSNFSRGLSVQERISISFPQKNQIFFKGLVFLITKNLYVLFNFYKVLATTLNANMGSGLNGQQLVVKVKDEEQCRQLEKLLKEKIAMVYLKHVPVPLTSRQEHKNVSFILNLRGGPEP